jgi:hypothetical protein
LEAGRPKMTQAVVPGVPAKATQGTEAQRRDFGWAEASIWTDRMVSALVNGVTGGRVARRNLTATLSQNRT